MTDDNKIIPFIYDESPVRVVKDDGGNPWFVAKDICCILGIANPTQAVENLDDDEVAMYHIVTPERPDGMDVNSVNESGLYTLIFRSRKPAAKTFRRWVTHDVLPSLRKYGIYGTGNGKFADNKTSIQELTNIINRTVLILTRLEQRLDVLDNKPSMPAPVMENYPHEQDAPSDFFEFRKVQMDKVNTDVRKFLIAKTVIEPEASTMCSWMYSMYEQWCFANCLIPRGRNTFYADLRAAVSGYGDIKATRKSQLYVTGIRMKDSR